VEIGVITNPNSRKNKRRAHRRDELADIVGSHGIVAETHSTDDIKPILRGFLRDGVDYWVADGGDGTLHWLLNEGCSVLQETEFRSQDTPMPVTVPTNGGTIDFVAKKAGIKGDGATILRDLTDHMARGQKPDEVEIDTMSIRMLVCDEGGERWVDRVGFASAAGGIGQRFFSHYYAENDPTNVTIVKVFALAILSLPFNFTALGRLPAVPDRWGAYSRHLFQGANARVIIDGEEMGWTDHTGIHAGSIDINLGGAIRIFPRATAPGNVHYMVGQASPIEVVANIPSMVAGRNIRTRTIWDGVGKKMSVEALGDELLAPVVDGELYKGIRKIEFDLGPTVRLPRIGQRGASVGNIMRLGWRKTSHR
jgi:diacylglycerol kinase family enzyme